MIGTDERLTAILRKLRDLDYAFVTPTPLTIERVNARPGNEVATDLRGAFGWSRPFRLDLLPDPLRDLMLEAGLLRPHRDLFGATIRVSSLDRDLFIHSAYPTLAADAVFFGPDTYRFVGEIGRRLRERSRPVEHAVDIGCGAGPGGVAVARARPSARVTMVDINDTALAYAAASAAVAGATGATALKSDLLDGLDGEFDLIVSNPPYLNDALGRAYRHGGGTLGAALSIRIVEAALERLARGGELILYTGVAMVGGRDPFLAAVEPVLADRRLAWTYHEIDPDVFGEELETTAYGSADRIAAVALNVVQGG